MSGKIGEIQSKARSAPSIATRDEAPRRKSFRLRQSKIDRAMEALGTSTETETIEQALEMVVFRKALGEGVEAMRGTGLANLLDD